jgi:hypothetical protein
LVLLSVPLIYYGVQSFGVLAAAISWLVVNTLYVIFITIIVSKFLGVKDIYRWMRYGFFQPVLISVMACVMLKYVFCFFSFEGVVPVASVIVLSYVVSVALLLLNSNYKGVISRFKFSYE